MADSAAAVPEDQQRLTVWKQGKDEVLDEFTGARVASRNTAELNHAETSNASTAHSQPNPGCLVTTPPTRRRLTPPYRLLADGGSS